MCSKAGYQENDGNDVLANERHGFAILHSHAGTWQRLVSDRYTRSRCNPRNDQPSGRILANFDKKKLCSSGSHVTSGGISMPRLTRRVLDSPWVRIRLRQKKGYVNDLAIVSFTSWHRY